MAAATFGAVDARADEPPREPLTGPKLDEVLRDIARARQGVRTFSGPFSQVRKLGLMKAQIVSQGRVTLVLPDRLRWELLPPDEVVYFVTPEGLAYRNRSSQGAVRANDARTLAAGLEDLRAMLGGDLAVLRRRYDLKAWSRADELVFEATALASAEQQLGGARGLRAISFGVGRDRVRPTFATLVEKNGDRSDIRFGDLRPNVAVDPRTMQL